MRLAFGHHRVEAAKRKGYAKVGLVVAPRSDADMLRMMADENREEFKGIISSRLKPSPRGWGP